MPTALKNKKVLIAVAAGLLLGFLVYIYRRNQAAGIASEAAATTDQSTYTALPQEQISYDPSPFSSAVGYPAGYAQTDDAFGPFLDLIDRLVPEPDGRTAAPPAWAQPIILWPPSAPPKPGPHPTSPAGKGKTITMHGKKFANVKTHHVVKSGKGQGGDYLTHRIFYANGKREDWNYYRSGKNKGHWVGPFNRHVDKPVTGGGPPIQPGPESHYGPVVVVPGGQPAPTVIHPFG